MVTLSFARDPPLCHLALRAARTHKGGMARRTEISAGILAFRRSKGLEILLAHPGGPY